MVIVVVTAVYHRALKAGHNPATGTLQVWCWLGSSEYIVIVLDVQPIRMNTLHSVITYHEYIIECLRHGPARVLEQAIGK